MGAPHPPPVAKQRKEEWGAGKAPSRGCQWHGVDEGAWPACGPAACLCPFLWWPPCLNLGPSRSWYQEKDFSVSSWFVKQRKHHLPFSSEEGRGEAANNRYVIIHLLLELKCHRTMWGRCVNRMPQNDPTQRMRELRYFYPIPGESLVEGYSQRCPWQAARSSMAFSFWNIRSRRWEWSIDGGRYSPQAPFCVVAGIIMFVKSPGWMMSPLPRVWCPLTDPSTFKKFPPYFLLWCLKFVP